MSQQQAEYKVDGWVYLIQPVGHNVYKIGNTTNLEKRITQNIKKLKHSVKLIHAFRSKNCFHSEQDAHIIFSHAHLVSEWFILSDKDVAAFCAIKDYEL